MIALTQTLLDRGHAYVKDGSIFFRIASDEDYGRLSGIDVEQVIQGDRVAADEYDKDDARDFVLWKAAKPDEPTWGLSVGSGASRLAYRMLSDEYEIPRR